MSDITTRALLRLYPRPWRARYGEELTGLILQASGGSPSLLLKMDVALGGVRERLRVIGLLGNDLTPGDRARSGVLVVMWSWMLFVLGGIGVEKAAEHWQAAVPPASARLGEVAFAVLIAAAVTGLSVTGLLALSVWAQHLSVAQRNGGNDAYGAAVLCWVVLFAGCLFCWAAAAASTARHLNPTPRLLVLETRLAVAMTATMAAMTIASSIWWATVARSAPWFLSGTAPRTPGTVAPFNLVIPVAFMLSATLLASMGARSARRNVRSIASGPSLS